MKLNLEYDFDSKEYKMSINDISETSTDWCEAIKIFRWNQRQIDKEIE